MATIITMMTFLMSLPPSLSCWMVQLTLQAKVNLYECLEIMHNNYRLITYNVAYHHCAMVPVLSVVEGGFADAADRMKCNDANRAVFAVKKK